MARPLRLELAGGLYHVTSRGDRREDIYLDDADRETWLKIFAAVCARYGWVCHAWCQMTNHYHVVVETASANLAAGMRQLNGVYTQSFNRRHGRVGHVFQGRYKAILVERDGYLLELARYVVLNPVRAGLVADVADWPWSSYPAMLARRAPPPWLQRDWLLGQFARSPTRAAARYVAFVRDGVGRPSIWDDLRGQVFLGDEDFVRRHLDGESAGDRAEIPRAQRRPLAKPLTAYAAIGGDRGAAMAAAYASGDYSMKAIAAYFGVHYATVSRAVKRAEAAEMS